ncbi:MAG: hypothetical protein JO352_02110 [Chloroflexi bacterium]|nr:hypothetical protein [Chloroflexota bacterium]
MREHEAVPGSVERENDRSAVVDHVAERIQNGVQERLPLQVRGDRA